MYIYEQCWNLTYHCNLTFFEAWNMPVWLRRWWMNRTNKFIEEENKRKQRQQ